MPGWLFKSDWDTAPRNPTWADFVNLAKDQGRAGFGAWGGNVDAGGYSLQNLGGVNITSNLGSGCLHITNTANVLGLDFGLLAGGAAADAYLYQRANAALIIGTNNTERIRITNGGNVGIGTVNPGFRLTVEGGRSTFASNADRYAIGLLYQAGGPVAWIGTDLNGDHIFSEAGGVERMRIKATGNVGIGAASPNAILEVQGAKYGSPSTSGSASGDQNLRIGALGHGEVLDFGNAGNPWIQARNSINFASNFALLLNPNGGNVGIGTLNPTAALTVVGLTVHANNAAAIAAGKAAGAFYRNGADPDVVCVVH